MIVRNVREKRPIRSVAAVCVGAALLVVACETPAPTTVDEGEEATFVAHEVPNGSTEGQVASGSIVRRLSPGLDLGARLGRGAVRFFVDDVEQGEVPADLEASSIDRVEIEKSPDGESGAVYVYTRDRGDEPLIYVDGIRLEGDLSSISPDQVERIEILKGEAATAAYGPAGAAGVVQIMMKERGGRITPR